MAGKKRKRAKRKNPKRAHAKRVHHKRRRAAANPAKRRRRAKRRHAVANPPRRSSARRTHARRRVRHAVANPRRRHSRRRHRSNPAIPTWAMAGLAAALGLVGYAVANDGSFAITQRTDPTLQTLQRNRYILGGLLTIGGVALAAFASPMLGVGLAAGGLAAFAGTQASNALGHLLDKKNPDGSLQTAQPAPLSKSINGVWGGGHQMINGVWAGDRQQINGVWGDGHQMIAGIGAYDDGPGYFGG